MNPIINIIGKSIVKKTAINLGSIGLTYGVSKACKTIARNLTETEEEKQIRKQLKQDMKDLKNIDVILGAPNGNIIGVVPKKKK